MREQEPATRPGHGFTCPLGAGPAGCGGGAGVRLSSAVVAGVDGHQWCGRVGDLAVFSEAAAFPPEREQSFGGGGGEIYLV